MGHNWSCFQADTEGELAHVVDVDFLEMPIKNRPVFKEVKSGVQLFSNFKTDVSAKVSMWNII